MDQTYYVLTPRTACFGCGAVGYWVCLYEHHFIQGAHMISCGDYDYIEIACMHAYVIELHLLNGSIISGKALDTQRNPLKQECIKIHSQGSDMLVVLDDVKSMTVQTKNPSFSHVNFTTKT